MSFALYYGNSSVSTIQHCSNNLSLLDWTLSQGFSGDDFGEDDEGVLDVLTEVVDHQLDLVDANLEAHNRQDDGKTSRARKMLTTEFFS